MVKKFIDEMSKINTVRVITFSGGEPTLVFDKLIYGIRYASSKGFITRLVTNAWWAKIVDDAKRYIEKLKESGLQEINTSYDDYHAKFIKIDNIANLVREALRNGLRIAIGTITLRNSYYNSTRVKKELAEKLNMSIEELDRQVFFIEDQPTPVGLASNLYATNKQLLDLNRQKVNLGCPNILSAIALMPNGDIKACCGHAIFQQREDFLLLGNILSLNEGELERIIRGAQRNLLYAWLFFRGPRRILKQVTGKDYKLASICHGCAIMINNK